MKNLKTSRLILLSIIVLLATSLYMATNKKSSDDYMECLMNQDFKCASEIVDYGLYNGVVEPNREEVEQLYATNLQNVFETYNIDIVSYDVRNTTDDGYSQEVVTILMLIDGVEYPVTLYVSLEYGLWPGTLYSNDDSIENILNELNNALSTHNPG